MTHSVYDSDRFDIQFVEFFQASKLIDIERNTLRSAMGAAYIFVPTCACGTLRSFPFVHIVFRRVRLYC